MSLTIVLLENLKRVFSLGSTCNTTGVSSQPHLDGLVALDVGG